MAKSWGRGLNQYRDMVTRVMIDSDDPNFDKVDLDLFADGVHELVVGGERNVKVQRQYGEGFRVVCNGKPFGDQAFWDWKHDELIEDQGPKSAFYQRGHDGKGGWSRNRAAQESTPDFDAAMAKAQELAKLPERKSIQYEPSKPLTKRIAEACVYPGAGYGTTSDVGLRAICKRLGDTEHKLPRGITRIYLSVQDDADVTLEGGEVVFLSQWGRINGAIKDGKAYELTES
jgi:hypothetical protein